MQDKYNFKFGFTLAEVLITLAIVGVIASLTIPSLVANLGNAQERTQLKKVYASLSQAFQLVENENGGIASVFGSTMNNGSDSLNIFVPKLNVIKKCIGTGCLYSTAVKYYDGSTNYATDLEDLYGNNYGKALLADGSMIIIHNYSSDCTTQVSTLYNICADIHVDVNGSKGPNQIGKDYFTFWVLLKGIYPQGMIQDGKSCGAGTNMATSSGCTATVLAGQ